MENGCALLCSPTFLFFILIISLFPTETHKNESTNEGKATPNSELMLCLPIKMFHRFHGTKIYGKHRGKRFLNTPDDRKFVDLIMSPLEKAWLKTSNIILLGDFNCDLKSISTTKCDPTAIQLLQIFDALNLQNIVQEPTRGTPLSSTLIHLIVTTRKNLVSFVGTYRLWISDHNLIQQCQRTKDHLQRKFA